MSPRGDDDRREDAWHNRTSTLLGASIAGLVAIVVLVVSVSWVVRQFEEPEQAPLNFVDPTYSSPSSASPGVTTTETITSTRPPTTTDIDPGSSVTTSPMTPSTPTTTSETPDSSTESSEVEEPTEDPFSTTRNRPRYNVTRTLYPGT